MTSNYRKLVSDDGRVHPVYLLDLENLSLYYWINRKTTLFSFQFSAFEKSNLKDARMCSLREQYRICLFSFTFAYVGQKSTFYEKVLIEYPTIFPVKTFFLLTILYHATFVS